jgi:hypothetical protein
MKSLTYLISALVIAVSFSACAKPMPVGGGVCENPKCKCPKPCQCGSGCKCGINGNAENMGEKK